VGFNARPRTACTPPTWRRTSRDPGLNPKLTQKNKKVSFQKLFFFAQYQSDTAKPPLATWMSRRPRLPPMARRAARGERWSARIPGRPESFAAAVASAG